MKQSSNDITSQESHTKKAHYCPVKLEKTNLHQVPCQVKLQNFVSSGPGFIFWTLLGFHGINLFFQAFTILVHRYRMVLRYPKDIVESRVPIMVK